MNSIVSQDKLDIIQQFTLFDDTFMSKVFEDEACARLLIDILFHIKDMPIEVIDTQHSIGSIPNSVARRLRFSSTCSALSPQNSLILNSP